MPEASTNTGSGVSTWEELLHHLALHSESTFAALSGCRDKHLNAKCSMSQFH